MSRLTKRAENGAAVYATPSGDPIKWENNRNKVLRKLAEYEDLEEQGLLLRLPCKPKEIIWCADEFGLRPSMYTSNSAILYDMECGTGIGRTKEEAEQALAKMKEV